MPLKDEAWHLHLRWGRQTPVMLQAGGNLVDPSPALSRLNERRVFVHCHHQPIKT